MAVVKPYKALRFTEKAGKLDEIVCPPYDIISEEQRIGYIKRNPNNIIRLELPREGEDQYKTAGETFKRWMDEGILKVDEKDAFYLYDIDFSVKNEIKTISGIIGRIQLEEFSKGIVLPHEETLSKAKNDRLQLFKSTNCHFSQIYSLYIDNGDIAGLIDKRKEQAPDIDITDEDGLRHRVWIASEKDFVEKITELFADKKLYIADGHHRYETSINYRNYLREEKGAKIGDPSDYVMMYLADMSQKGLVIFPTHRIVRDFENFDKQKLISECSDYFEITDDLSIDDVESILDEQYQNNKAAFGLYTGGNKFTLLVSKVDAVPEDILNGSKSVRGLDVSILHSLVLEKHLGIDKENMANQINLSYTRDLSEALDVVKNGKANCSFILNPTRVEEIKEVALDGEKMPQKSTYFYPKLITGLVMNKVDEK